MPGTVTVACKMPHGIILRLFDMVEVEEALQGGGTRTVKRAQPREKTVVINGYLSKFRGAAIAPPNMPASYALTHNVDKDFFEEWMKQNASLAAVMNKLIFASEKQDNLNGQIRENKDRRCGFEPIDPDKLPKGIKTFTKEAA
jgi:hypothetical protein